MDKQNTQNSQNNYIQKNTLENVNYKLQNQSNVYPLVQSNFDELSKKYIDKNENESNLENLYISMEKGESNQNIKQYETSSFAQNYTQSQKLQLQQPVKSVKKLAFADDVESEKSQKQKPLQSMQSQRRLSKRDNMFFQMKLKFISRRLLEKTRERMKYNLTPYQLNFFHIERLILPNKYLFNQSISDNKNFVSSLLFPNRPINSLKNTFNFAFSYQGSLQNSKQQPQSQITDTDNHSNQNINKKNGKQKNNNNQRNRSESHTRRKRMSIFKENFVILKQEKQVRNQICDKVNKFIIQAYKYLNKIPIIKPQSLTKTIWNFIILSILGILFFFIPLNIIFYYTNEGRMQYQPSKNMSGYLQFMMFILIIDMILSLFTGYYERGIIQSDKIKIIKQYCQKNFFKQILPNLILFHNVLRGNSLHEDLSYPQYFKTGSNLYLLLFYLQIFHFSNILLEIQRFFKFTERQANWIKLLNLNLQILLIIHISSFFWLYMGEMELSVGHNQSWITYNQVNNYWYDKYIKSIYFMTVTMLTVGYGDIYPTTNEEIIFVILIQLISTILFAYILQTIGQIITDLQKKQNELNRKNLIISHHMQTNNVTADLQYQIQQYLNYYYKEIDEENEQENEIILNILPDVLKEQLFIETNQLLLQNSVIFKNFSQIVQQKSVFLIKQQRFSPEDLVIEEGKQDSCSLYFIVKGEVEMSFIEQSSKQGVNNKVIIQKFKKGQCFGESCFFDGLPRKYTVKCLDFCTFKKINRQDFINLLQQNFQQDYEKFCHIKDQLLLQGYAQELESRCQSCKSLEHGIDTCKYLHLYPDRYNLIKKGLLQEKQKRNQEYQRENIVKYNTLYNKNKIISDQQYFEVDNHDFVQEYCDYFKCDTTYMGYITLKSMQTSNTNYSQNIRRNNHSNTNPIVQDEQNKQKSLRKLSQCGIQKSPSSFINVENMIIQSPKGKPKVYKQSTGQLSQNQRQHKKQQNNNNNELVGGNQNNATNNNKLKKNRSYNNYSDAFGDNSSFINIQTSQNMLKSPDLNPINHNGSPQQHNNINYNNIQSQLNNYLDRQLSKKLNLLHMNQDLNLNNNNGFTEYQQYNTVIDQNNANKFIQNFKNTEGDPMEFEQFKNYQFYFPWNNMDFIVESIQEQLNHYEMNQAKKQIQKQLDQNQKRYETKRSAHSTKLLYQLSKVNNNKSKSGSQQENDLTFAIDMNESPLSLVKNILNKSKSISNYKSVLSARKQQKNHNISQNHNSGQNSEIQNFFNMSSRIIQEQSQIQQQRKQEENSQQRKVSISFQSQISNDNQNKDKNHVVKNLQPVNKKLKKKIQSNNNSINQSGYDLTLQIQQDQSNCFLNDNQNQSLDDHILQQSNKSQNCVTESLDEMEINQKINKQTKQINEFIPNRTKNTLSVFNEYSELQSQHSNNPSNPNYN